MAHGVEAIDWDLPWLAPWRATGKAIHKELYQSLTAPPLTCAQALNAKGFWAQPPVCFVPQSELPVAEAYEAFIFRTRRVPTRDGLHDFFNGLCWLQFPQTKLRLNQLQAAQIAHTGVQPVRGPARDALTLFDENVAIFQGPDAVWDALVNKQWSRLFVELRSQWSHVQLVLFGHALLEKLVQPRKSITAHVYRALTQGPSIEELDAWVADSLNANTLATKPFAHLPVLGVPGWWAANEEPAFYADADVFRAPRSNARR